MSEKKQQTAYPLRMPIGLREKLEESAAKAKRSLNAEIVARLDASYDYIPQSRDISHEAALAELSEIHQQRMIVSEMRVGKFHAVVALQDQLEKAETPETKAALSAAIFLAKAESDSLSKKDRELNERYYTLQAQLRLNARAPADE